MAQVRTWQELVALGDSELLLELHRRADRKARGVRRDYWLRVSELLLKAARLSEDLVEIEPLPLDFLKPDEGLPDVPPVSTADAAEAFEGKELES